MTVRSMVWPQSCWVRISKSCTDDRMRTEDSQAKRRESGFVFFSSYMSASARASSWSSE